MVWPCRNRPGSIVEQHTQPAPVRVVRGRHRLASNMATQKVSSQHLLFTALGGRHANEGEWEKIRNSGWTGGLTVSAIQIDELVWEMRVTSSLSEDPSVRAVEVDLVIVRNHEMAVSEVEDMADRHEAASISIQPAEGNDDCYYVVVEGELPEGWETALKEVGIRPFADSDVDRERGERLVNAMRTLVQLN